ncbi:hypothetical protein MUK42_15748 [Musa troglodytarum]|uniref:Uncharacterized protein n=1 Tax=Musa troglodytarum TaxID=320322 RepID=A0A9E7HF30_9LILI|nr:hypothetical protein MUK42_15748 [Musa troglodytarum]
MGSRPHAELGDLESEIHGADVGHTMDQIVAGVVRGNVATIQNYKLASLLYVLGIDLRIIAAAAAAAAGDTSQAELPKRCAFLSSCRRCACLLPFSLGKVDY